MIDSLKPEKGVNKIIVSSPGGFGNEYKSNETGLLITHAFDQFGELMKRRISGPAFRMAYVVAFRSEPDLQDFTYMGELICSCLSVLFGKRFDCHGVIESNEFFQIPNLLTYYQLRDPDLPQNSNSPRNNLRIPLDLNEIHRLDNLLKLFSQERTPFFNAFFAAAKFYWNALRSFEEDPEIAYLHLITAGEILSNYCISIRDDLFDDDTKKYFSEIENGLDNGKIIVKHFRSRLFQVKKGFTSTISKLINDDFFSVTDGPPFLNFKHEDFEKRICAAYDLRSKYVHTGFQFGQVISRPIAADVFPGKIDVHDKEINKILNLTPTYFGLERVMRYCLLKFAQENDVNIDDRLRGESHLSTKSG